MLYKNGVYVAFDGNGEKNPTQSDLKYLELLRAWDKNENIDFDFLDSHLKTYQVRDDSTLATLKGRLRERMSNSKNMLIILSGDTNYNRGLLNEEIRWAVEDYHLPLIVAYTGFESILDPEAHKDRWPMSLRHYILLGPYFGENFQINCIHIAFKEKAIQKAIDTFGVHDAFPKGPLDCFSYEDYYG